MFYFSNFRHKIDNYILEIINQLGWSETKSDVFLFKYLKYTEECKSSTDKLLVIGQWQK